MTETEARKLKKGDRVQWKDGTPGVVVAADYDNCIVFHFENDGDNSYLDPKDCESVVIPT